MGRSVFLGWTTTYPIALRCSSRWHRRLIGGSAKRRRFTVLEVDLEKVLSELASLYIAHHAAAVLRESFPLLSENLPLEVLSLDTRAVTALSRLTTDKAIGGLLMHTTAEIFGVARN